MIRPPWNSQERSAPPALAAARLRAPGPVGLLASGLLHGLCVAILAGWAARLPSSRPTPTVTAELAPQVELEESLESRRLEPLESDVSLASFEVASAAPDADVAHAQAVDALAAARFDPRRPQPVGFEPLRRAFTHGRLALGGGFDDGEGGGAGGRGATHQAAFHAILRQMRDEGLDLVLVFDSTASMGAELRQVKQRILAIGDALREAAPRTRISACTYRDRRATFLVKGTPLTEDFDTVHRFVTPITADGGGDYPEAVLDGLRWAIAENEFRPKARKVILLFGDAPPHAGTLADCELLAAAFHQKQGGRISTVSCRKRECLLEFSRISAAGGGEALFLKDRGDLMEELVVLIFGNAYRQEVRQLFQFAAVPAQAAALTR